MTSGNPENLRRAAQEKSATAMCRAEKGLRQLIKDGKPVNFQAVATVGGVSKDFLYRSALRPRIERLRDAARQHVVPRPPAAPPDGARSTSNVVRALTLQLRDLRQAHRDEVTELKLALEAAHGELLQLRRRHGLT